MGFVSLLVEIQPVEDDAQVVERARVLRMGLSDPLGGKLDRTLLLSPGVVEVPACVVDVAQVGGHGPQVGVLRAQRRLDQRAGALENGDGLVEAAGSLEGDAHAHQGLHQLRVIGAESGLELFEGLSV